jgi:hypothetical protein
MRSDPNKKIVSFKDLYAAQRAREGANSSPETESKTGPPTPVAASPHPYVPLPPSDGQTPSGGHRGAAPARDFNRRANSIERDVLPAGKFPGASKKVYDALYLRTRGAVKPTREITATKRQLAEWSGVKNRKTIDGHLRYLETCGLLVRQWDLGSNEGYTFEVLLPEETSLVDRGTEGDRGAEGTDQKRDRGTDQKRDRGGQSQTSDLQDTSDLPKTFKTNREKDDDEPAARLLAALARAAREITGREPSSAEAERWQELGELLATELKIAAGRTTVSSVPAFLTEHLRRRLWKKEKRQIEAERAEAPKDAVPPVDASQCPDCFGTGMWYPEGYDKGVAKCRHDRL